MFLKDPEGKILLHDVRLAATFFTRARGLLFTPPLKEGEGLWIKPCNSVHTFFMGYPIDVVFLDAGTKVIHIIKHMEPGHISRIIRKAKSVLEIRPGAADELGLKINDVLDLAE